MSQGYIVEMTVKVQRDEEHDFEKVIEVEREFDLPPSIDAVGLAMDSVRDLVTKQLNHPERARGEEGKQQ